MSEPRRPFIVDMLVPITVEVLAHDEDGALGVAAKCQIGLVGGLALVNGSTGFPVSMTVKEVQATEP